MNVSYEKGMHINKHLQQVYSLSSKLLFSLIYLLSHSSSILYQNLPKIFQNLQHIKVSPATRKETMIHYFFWWVISFGFYMKHIYIHSIKDSPSKYDYLYHIPLKMRSIRRLHEVKSNMICFQSILCTQISNILEGIGGKNHNIPIHIFLCLMDIITTN